MSIKTRLSRLLNRESRHRQAALARYQACCLQEGLVLAPQARRRIVGAARPCLPGRGFTLEDAGCLPEAWRQWMQAWQDVFAIGDEAGFTAPDVERVPTPPEEPPGRWQALESEAAEGETGAARALFVLMLARGLHRYREERTRCAA